MKRHTYNYNTSWSKIERVFPEGPALSILDLGCGDGRLFEHLTGSHTVSGIDSGADAVAQARQRGINAVQGDLDTLLPFASGSFDVICALDILEHIVDVGLVLTEVRRLLKKNGSFICSLPNHFDARTRLAIFAGAGIIRWSQRQYEKKSWEYSHIRFWTLRELKEMLREHDLYPEVWQFNFMSQGLLPTRLVPALVRRTLVRLSPQLWSGKFIVRCRMSPPASVETILLDTTPQNF